jgi:hypothetical protein
VIAEVASVPRIKHERRLTHPPSGLPGNQQNLLVPDDILARRPRFPAIGAILRRFIGIIVAFSTP